MPVNQQFDFILNGKGYQLSRAQGIRGRAWRRTGAPDSPERRLPNAAEFGQLPGEIDHVEVWNDWSGGFGDAYRDPQNPNRYHWSENFEPRFPHQLAHAQEMRLMPSFSASFNTNADGFFDSPFWPHTLLNVPSDRYVFPAVTLMGHSFIAFIRPAAAASLANEPTLNHIPLGFNPLSYYAMPSTVFSGALYFGAIKNASLGVANRGFLQIRRSGGGLEGPVVGQGVLAAGNRLWRYFGDTVASPSEHFTRISSAATDVTATQSWSATLNVGNGEDDARSMIALDDQVFVGMADGLYAGDQSGTFMNVMPEIANQKHYDNCRDLTIYQGGIVAPHIGGVFWYRPYSNTALVQDIGPQGINSNRSPVRGHIRAVRTFGPWLHAGLWTGSQSYLLAGLIPPEGGRPIWHTMQRLPHVAKVHRIHFDGITVTSGGEPIPNRAWIATDASIATNGTAPVYWFPVPQMHDNPLADVGPFVPNYTASARMDLPSTDFGAPATPKVYRSVEIWADNMASGFVACDVFYTVDNSGTRILLGTVRQSPKETLYFPSGEGSFVTGQSIALSIDSRTIIATQTPIYRAIILRGALRPKVAELITAVVDVADNKRDRRGGVMRPGHVMLNELRTLAEQASPVQLVDLAGATSWVQVLAPVEEQEVFQDNIDNPTIAATVRLGVLEFSGAA